MKSISEQIQQRKSQLQVLLKRRLQLSELGRKELLYWSQTVSFARVHNYIFRCSVIERLFEVNLLARKSLSKLHSAEQSLNAWKSTQGGKGPNL